jgi:hypothetical protein
MQTNEMILKIQTWFDARKIKPMEFLQGELGMVSDNAMTLEEVDGYDLGIVHYSILPGDLERLVNLTKGKL